jgi:hypothetical protein
MTTCACGNCQFFDHQSKVAGTLSSAGEPRRAVRESRSSYQPIS